MSAHSSPLLPSTRSQGLARLATFAPRAAAYGKRRNHVEAGHENVSRLSPAARTRLLLETEICRAARELHSPRSIETFEREVWWRSYWKGWLEMRPAVWRSYRRNLDELDWCERAERVARGESGVAIMDHFARELIATGYLHNHARMWWAAYWIHVERLPWQLGADFFLRRLHDGDAASNTLSWRWVAGLHTRGKSYLVRRANVEKYVAPEIMAGASRGIERLEGGEVLDAAFEEPPPPDPMPEEPPPPLEPPWGLWLHDEDLLGEASPLADSRPSSIAAPLPTGIWRENRYSESKRDFLRAATADGARRAFAHFGVEPLALDADDLPEALASWARSAGLRTVAAMRPFVGPLGDRLEAIEASLGARDVRLVLVRRPSDRDVMRHATAGFFRFWKRSEAARERAISAL